MKARDFLYLIWAAWIFAQTSTSLPAQEQTRSEASSDRPTETTPGAPTQISKPTLADFSWLTGRWQGTWGPRTAQQTWGASKAGAMVGTFQLAQGDKTLVVELFTLIENASGIKLYLRHFTPSLTAWEKSEPITLYLESSDGRSFFFTNLVDGEPKREVITQVDADTYIARSEIVPEKGDAQATEITYHRVLEGPSTKRRGSKSASQPNHQP